MGKVKVKKSIRVYAMFCVAFLLFAICSGVSLSAEATSALECADGATSSGVCSTDTADVHVSVEGGWAISVSSAGALGVDVSPTNSGVLSTVVDNVNVYTNIPTGYQLYLNSTSGSTNIYNSSDTEQSQNHFVETTGTKATPVELSGDTWGYSLDATPTTFAKVALTSEDADSNIYTNPTKTSSSGDDIPVTYGFMSDTKLSPGTYSTSVTYTAIADAPAFTISSVNPSTILYNDQTDKTITITTSVPATELAFGEVSAKIGTVDLTDCAEITNDGFRGVTCVYSGDLDYGTYNVELTSSWHNATYVLANGLKIGDNRTMSDITYMQEMNSDICANSTIDTAYTLKDSRDQKSYRIRKHKDNNCWMNQNLALDGNRTLTPADSNVTEDRKLAANVASNVTTNNTSIQIYSGHANSVTTSCRYDFKYCVTSSEKYGNSYNWMAATAGLGTATTIETVKESVCPSAANGETWRLPDAGSDDEDADVGLKTYKNLFLAYNLTPVWNNNVGGQVQTIQKSPLSFPITGHFIGGSYGLNERGRYGYYWTRTPIVDNTNNAYIMYIVSTYGGLTPKTYEGKNIGCSIRCVLGE